MSLPDKIILFASSLPKGVEFATKDVLHLGKRAAVDSAIHRLIKKGVLLRAARGIFVLNGPDVEMPSVYEIAKAKARVFGKNIAIVGEDAVKILTQETAELGFKYASNGKSSSFLSYKGRIEFEGTTMNRVKAGDSKAGLFVRALAFLGEKSASVQIVKTMLASFSEADLQELRFRMPKYMTAWMADTHVHTPLNLKQGHDNEAA